MFKRKTIFLIQIPTSLGEQAIQSNRDMRNDSNLCRSRSEGSRRKVENGPRDALQSCRIGEETLRC